MAEATGLRNNALPYPVYGAPFTVVFPMLDADGDLVTGATTPDAEVSKNGDTFADCTNESTEIATNSGMYYLTLTGTEMTADIVAVIAKSATSGMKTTPIVLYPRKLVSIRAGTSAGGAAGYITLDASASAVDDYYNGMLCVGVLDGTTEARIISDYTGSNKQAAVTPSWNTTPDADDTFTIYLTEGVQLNQANLTHIAGAAVSTSTAQLGVNAVNIGGTAQTGRDIGASVLLSTGTGTGQLDFTSGVVKANLAQILGSAITGTAAQLAAAFTKWFNVATPTGTINSLPDAVAGAAGGVFIAGTNAATTVTTALTTTFTGNLTGSVASVTGAVGSVTGAVGSVTGAVGSVTGNVGGNVTGSVGSVAANGITATSIATDAINAAAVKADAVTKIQNGLATPTNITAGTITTVTNLTNAPTAGDFTATMKSSITAAVPTVAGIADGVWDEAIAGHAGAGSTGAALSAATAPSAATVADAVWDEAIAGHLTGGTTGAALNAAGSAGDPWTTGLPGAYVAGQAGYIVGTNVNATISSRSSHSAADVWSVATRVLTANTNLNDPSAATIADAVWDEATAGHAGAGTTGLALTSASAPTAAAVADAVWDEATAGHTGAGTTGLALTSASAPTVGQIDTQLSATHGAGVWGGAAGSGSKSETITVTVGGSPQDGVNVWVTSDAGGATVVASGFTNASGQVTFLLDPGTYYAWCNRGGTNFTNPTTITVV